MRLCYAGCADHMRFAGTLGGIAHVAGQPEKIARMAITYDPTISLGSLTAAGTIILAIGAATWRNALTMGMGLKQISDVDKRVISIEAKIDSIAVMQSQLADGKQRMDRLEDRLHDIERRTQHA